jgi:cytoskeleton protein RodZ
MAAARQGRRARARERAEAESALAAQADYTGVGATLRVARERNGLEVVAVATTLRVQPAHLVAIEQGRFAELPGQVYAIGFLRSYAEYLGFDGEAAVRRLKEEMSGEDGRAARLTFPVPVAEARTPGPRLLLFAMVAAVATAAPSAALRRSD